MFRRFAPLAVAIVILVGCKKKPESTAPGVDSDPTATFTIKVRDEQAGDKTDVVETVNGTSEGGGGGKTEKSKEERRFEYTEHIIDHPGAGAKATKLTRTYKTAQKQDRATNALKAAKYEGKTVNIEKKGKAYEFTVDGKKLDFIDSADLAGEFRNAEKQNVNELFPKTAVKVGDSWSVDLAAMKAMMGSMPFPVDAAKSKMSGKLTRAYTNDGKQWGVITFTFDLAVDSDTQPEPKVKAKGRTTGSIKIDGTIDVVIDGSSRDGTMKMTIKMDVTGKDEKNEMKIVADMTQEKTVKTVK